MKFTQSNTLQPSSTALQQNLCELILKNIFLPVAQAKGYWMSKRLQKTMHAFV